jgi:hypothetical protein
MLEWEVLEDEQARVEAVQALRSTPPGRRALQASCQRQVHLKKLVSNIDIKKKLLIKTK